MTPPKAKPPAIERDWLSKTLAGGLLGFALAIGCSGLFLQLGPPLAGNIKPQLAMWMVAPIWLGVLSCCYFFQNGKRAWFGLGGATLLVAAALGAARFFKS